MRTTRITAFVIAFLLTSCANNAPWYENTKNPGTAVIRGSFVTPSRTFQGEAHVRIVTIDGLRAPLGFAPELYVAPGKHRLFLELNNFGRESHVGIEEEFDKDRLYRLRADLAGNVFVVRLLDETEEEARKQDGGKVLQTYDVPVFRTIPVYVPIAH